MIRPRTVELLALAALFAVGGACSSRDRRDQNYGKDAGKTFVALEAGMPDTSRNGRDAGVDGHTDGGGDTSETGADVSGDVTADSIADAASDTL